MTDQEVRIKIEHEMQVLVEGKKEIEDHLVSPELETFEDFQGNNLNLWVVLRKDEYLIVFNEAVDKFGLAYRNVLNENMYLGNSGSLGEAYDDLVSREEK